MGTMKQMYTASLEYDQDTGASLCAHPEHAVEDMQRGQRWTSGAMKPSRQVLASRRKAKGLLESRLGWVTYTGDRLYNFTVESTAKYMARTDGYQMTEEDEDWYNGALRIGDDERIEACRCSCPAWQKGYAEWRGMRICKHVIWAWMKIEKGDINYAESKPEPVTLELGWDHGFVLNRIRRNGRFEETNETLEAVTQDLKSRGYKKTETKFVRIDGVNLVHDTWRC